MQTPLKSAIHYFGDYVLLGEIARGGMGVVYRALQVSLDREVAIKMLYSGQLASESAFRRFQTEAEAMGQLDHPNIVSIYEVGEHEGQRYLSMKLIDGENLAEQVADFALAGAPTAARSGDLRIVRGVDSKAKLRTRQHKIATLVGKVAQAVHYAHQRGVLHRDLKPSNILVDNQNEPHLTDFGLARLLHRGARQTQTESMMGTPSYMSPEQAAGRTKDVTVAADVFSLGAILYELLTGRPPYSSEPDAFVMPNCRRPDPPRPSKVSPRVDCDLETICLKCLEQEPAKRYSTAGKLADELSRYVHGEPIHARRIGRVERAWRLCRRHPGVTGLTAALVLAIGFIGFLIYYHVSQNTELMKRLEFHQWSRANPDHIFRVSDAKNVTLANDPTRFLSLNFGNLLKLESGDNITFKHPFEATFVSMRVMASQGEDGEAMAGSVIRISLKDLEDYDSGFRAALNPGGAQKHKNTQTLEPGAQHF